MEVSVCALVPYPLNTAPSQRYRIEQWLPHLKRRGLDIKILPFADQRLMATLHRPGRLINKAGLLAGAFLRRFKDIARSRDFDVVVVHRAACIAGPALVERAIAMFGKPVVFDFDDAIYLTHTTAANRRFGFLKFAAKTAAICRVSERVVVGNSYLADYALRFNKNVSVVPTSVDTDVYRSRGRSNNNGKVVIGWIGSSTSQTHLEMFAPVLAGIARRKNVELRVISDREPVLADVSFQWRPWTAETEVDQLSQFDIGIMPMPDDRWARGKCSLKALTYMAVGVPAVCSPVGMNSEVIVHGRNGMLASRPEEWRDCLDALIADSALRQRLGTEGRRTVEEGYSMERSAELFAEAIREAAC